MSMTEKVGWMHLRENKSVREIARLTSWLRNTVCAWPRESEVKERRYRRPAASTQLTPFAEGLRRSLAADAHRPKADRRAHRYRHSSQVAGLRIKARESARKRGHCKESDQTA